MPRKSAAELATVSNIQDHRPRISAPPGMSPEELFRKIVEDCHPLHFAQSDAPLLRSYCQAIILGDLAFEAAQQSPDALGDWEKCCRTMAARSVKLRLSPHSRSDPKTVMRAIAGHTTRDWR